MDFEEWYGEAKKTNNCGFTAKDFFEAGQQSKQAEIDALQGKISKVLYAISQSELYGDRAVWGIQDEIQELLK